MTKERTLLLLAFVFTVAAQIGTLEHWYEAVTTKFISATAIQVVIVLRGFYTQSHWDGEDRRDA